MAIEKRVIAGQEVGYNTETRSFCNLPKDYEEQAPVESIFTSMTDEQLSEYAAMKGVDISRAKTREAAIAKIEKAEQGE